MQPQLQPELQVLLQEVIAADPAAVGGVMARFRIAGPATPGTLAAAYARHGKAFLDALVAAAEPAETLPFTGTLPSMAVMPATPLAQSSVPTTVIDRYKNQIGSDADRLRIETQAAVDKANEEYRQKLARQERLKQALQTGLQAAGAVSQYVRNARGGAFERTADPATVTTTPKREEKRLLGMPPMLAYAAIGMAVLVAAFAGVVIWKKRQ